MAGLDKILFFVGRTITSAKWAIFSDSCYRDLNLDRMGACHARIRYRPLCCAGGASLGRESISRLDLESRLSSSFRFSFFRT